VVHAQAATKTTKNDPPSATRATGPTGCSGLMRSGGAGRRSSPDDRGVDDRLPAGNRPDDPDPQQQFGGIRRELPELAGSALIISRAWKQLSASTRAALGFAVRNLDVQPMVPLTMGWSGVVAMVLPCRSAIFAMFDFTTMPSAP